MQRPFCPAPAKRPLETLYHLDTDYASAKTTRYSLPLFPGIPTARQCLQKHRVSQNLQVVGILEKYIRPVFLASQHSYIKRGSIQKL